MKLPVVVLAGRPNTGKSTLFNRLLKKRRAITDPTPGVTRDPIPAEASLLGKRFCLVDTGGFKLDRDKDSPFAEIEALVHERTLKTIKNSGLIVLVLEAGLLTSEDEEFIAYLQQYRNKLIVAVNKTEGGRLQAESWNLLSYGFEKIFFISAEHGDNISGLEEAIVEFFKSNSDENYEDEPADEFENKPEEKIIRLALLGKPNTGKSTLINRLTSSQLSIVSAVPGTTRDVVEGSFVYKNRNFLVLDTAGIRRKSKVNKDIEYYSVNRAIKTIDEADIVFLIIDAAEGLSDQDKKIAGLIHDKGCGVIFVLNKWDTMPQIKNAFEAVLDRTRFLFPKMDYAPVINISAKDGSGIEKMLSITLKIYSQLLRRIETSALNDALAKWLLEYPPPLGKSSRFKLKYMVQLSSNPVKFAVFASRKHAVSEPYIAYIRNRIRRDLGFDNIPVEVEVRASPGKKK